MEIAIIGAGNGGQAMAGHFSMLGHSIRLYNRSIEKIAPIVASKKVQLYDKLDGSGMLKVVTDSIREAIIGAEIIMITTTANAHKDIATLIAPHLKDGQMIVLNPGRTLGAVEFLNAVRKISTKKVFVAEAQSLIYACRVTSPGNVNIIGVKKKVLLAAYPSNYTDSVLNKLNTIFPCYKRADNILKTSLENIGAMLHPSVIVCNASAIERGNMFYFYNDLTPAVGNLLEEIDNERINIGKAFGIKLLSLSEWVSYAYKGIKGDSLLEKIRNNPAYYKILAPNTLRSRLLLEDVPTGILPMIELARIAEVDTPVLRAILNITQVLLKESFTETGRTLKNLGLEGLNKDDLINQL